MSDKPVSKTSSATDVADFLRRAQQLASRPRSHQRGRLIFALDATASRQPTWDQASQLQGEMFIAADEIGDLSIQLVWYRGFNEFHASKWMDDSNALLQAMARVHCMAGTTQIGRILNHAVQSSRQQRLNALVFVGDCVEEQESLLFELAGQLGILGVPAFMFHEGAEPGAKQVFKRIASLSRGAYCAFDAGSAEQLRELLKAVAIYAAGGRAALEDFSRRGSRSAQRLLPQLR